APARSVPARRPRPVRLGEGPGRRRRAHLVDHRRPNGRPLAVTRPERPPPTRSATGDARRALAEAYDRTGRAWEDGPARLVYDRLAEVLVAASPVPLVGRRILDVGAGTGAAARSIQAAGGHTVAVDMSPGMLRANVTSAGRAVVADAQQLPVPSGVVDG